MVPARAIQKHATTNVHGSPLRDVDWKSSLKTADTDATRNLAPAQSRHDLVKVSMKWTVVVCVFSYKVYREQRETYTQQDTPEQV